MTILSIVTPTYNRAHLLPVLFESLKKQTCLDFEWIVVDDGSTDDTEKLIREWETNNIFTIKYVKKKNGGKHTALNAAQGYIQSDIVLIADSDDWLVEQAVETITQDWNRYKEDRNICGISYLRGSDPEHSLNGRHYKSPEEVSDFITVKVNDKNDCGSCEVIRTDVLKEFPFPEIEGERFIGESYLWFNANKYKTVYIDKVLYITEFFEDGLTKAGRKLRFDNPIGSMIVSNYGMDRKIRMTFRFRQSILYNCYSFKAQIGFMEKMKKSHSKIMTIIGLLPGYFLYIRWNRLFS